MVEIGNDVQITRGVIILTHSYDWSVLRKNIQDYMVHPEMLLLKIMFYWSKYCNIEGRNYW